MPLLFQDVSMWSAFNEMRGVVCPCSAVSFAQEHISVGNKQVGRLTERGSVHVADRMVV
jgi:hypothetical protein